MTGRVEGRIALVTGPAQGQGRAHALELASEGADLVLVDLLQDHEDVHYPMGTREQLDDTAAECEKRGAKVLVHVADVRDRAAMEAVVADAQVKLGVIDLVVANAGVCPSSIPFWEIGARRWSTIMDINVLGVLNTVSAAVPGMVENDIQGSVVITASLLGLKAGRNIADYAAAKHAVVGLMRSMALELAPRMIRVNALAPNSVDTNMINNPTIFKAFRPDLEHPVREDVIEAFRSLQPMPVPWTQPEDIAKAMIYLASHESRHVTGIVLPVDLGGGLL
ncbi:mycofactocin-coupled SDR family oxidoreductase [Nocardia sp. NPDC052278]|uniref:mycofactocin-coupled SDR family oxidoreductase n=1 Tax=unclassified Nocardia TaxID=2637762 RepID=UPI0036AEFBF0